MPTGVIIVSETEFRVVEFDAGDLHPVIGGERYHARACATDCRPSQTMRVGYVLFPEPEGWIGVRPTRWSAQALERAKCLAMADAEVVG